MESRHGSVRHPHLEGVACVLCVACSILIPASLFKSANNLVVVSFHYVSWDSVHTDAKYAILPIYASNPQTRTAIFCVDSRLESSSLPLSIRSTQGMEAAQDSAHLVDRDASTSCSFAGQSPYFILQAPAYPSFLDFTLQHGVSPRLRGDPRRAQRGVAVDALRLHHGQLSLHRLGRHLPELPHLRLARRRPRPRHQRPQPAVPVLPHGAAGRGERRGPHRGAGDRGVAERAGGGGGDVPRERGHRGRDRRHPAAALRGRRRLRDLPRAARVADAGRRDGRDYGSGRRALRGELERVHGDADAERRDEAVHAGFGGW